MKKFKILIFTLAICSSVIFTQIVSAAQHHDLRQVVNRSVKALANGNIEELRKVVDPETLQRRNKLYNNPRYSSFLKNYYSNSEFVIKEIKMVNDSLGEVHVEIISDGQVQAIQKMVFSKGYGSWKFVRKKQEF